jgi:hypothetical protein
MVTIVAATLRFMSECYAAALGRDEDYLGFVVKKRAVVIGECGDEDGGTDGAYCIHALLSCERGLLKRFCYEISCCYDDCVQVWYIV